MRPDQCVKTLRITLHIGELGRCCIDISRADGFVCLLRPFTRAVLHRFLGQVAFAEIVFDIVTTHGQRISTQVS